MNKAIIPTAQLLGILPASLATLGTAGLLASQAQQSRTNSEAFMQDGILGVLSNRQQQTPQQRTPQIQNQEPIAAARNPRQPREELKEEPMQAQREEKKEPEQLPLPEISEEQYDAMLEDEPMAEEDQPLLGQQDVPVLDQIPREQPVEGQPLNMNQALRVADDMIQQADNMIQQDQGFYKWLPAILVGIKYYTDINSILQRTYDIYRQTKEKSVLNAGSDAPIETRIKRPIPDHCQRYIYKDQFGQLRSIVYCKRFDGSQNIYEDQ